MVDFQEYAYWIAFAHLPRWRTENINKLIINILHDRDISFQDFFGMDKDGWLSEFNFNSKEINDLDTAKLELPNYSFLAEELLDQGFYIIPFNSDKYSKVLKKNLKTKSSPPLLYAKGNIDLLNEPSIAIVGSRRASSKSLSFTTNVANNAVREHGVVVSGYAKGVDRMALEATLEANGRSIIVLPQGIQTYNTGYKNYYSQLVDGDLLIVSAYHPKAPWSVGLAMGRNKYIYGLASKIYVAESDDKGGTWSGAIDGIKRGRDINVRLPDVNEINANNTLILNGASAVDEKGKRIEQEFLDDLENILKDNLDIPRTAEELIQRYNHSFDVDYLRRLIPILSSIETIKDNSQEKYRIKPKHNIQTNIF
tara:strand:+ start:1900 stop:3000 length:1101 start_codon:yes stop_codon:yes gene_type:complete